MYFRPQNNKSSAPGFTLIELLVVISIIGILSSFAVVALNSARIKARDALRKGDMAQMRTALVLYYDDNFSYPICGAGDWDDTLADYGSFVGDDPQDGCWCYLEELVPALGAGPRPVMPEPPIDPMNPTNTCTNPQHYRYISSPDGQEYAIIYYLEEDGEAVLKGW